MPAARRIDDQPRGGALNMAFDELLLRERRAPTLRFYRWARPTLSLGWFQRAAELPIEAVLGRGGEAVRRPTGGKAILHEHELTYSLCGPEVGPLGGGPAAAMRGIHEALGAELARQAGAPVTVRGRASFASDVDRSVWCFLDSSPLDLGLGGRKLLGSAARRAGGWILFHGSLVLVPPRETPEIAALGREPELDALAAALASALGWQLRSDSWSAGERRLAAAIAAARYARPEHLYRR